MQQSCHVARMQSASVLQVPWPFCSLVATAASTVVDASVGACASACAGGASIGGAGTTAASAGATGGVGGGVAGGSDALDWQPISTNAAQATRHMPLS